jgi:hypothetical protein
MLHPKPSNSSGSSTGSGYPPELSSFTATLLTLRNVLSVNMKKTKLTSSSFVLRLLYAGVFCVPGRISPILRLAVCGVMSFWKAWKTRSKPLSLPVFSGTFGRAEMHTPSRGKTCHLPSPCAGLWLIFSVVTQSGPGIGFRVITDRSCLICNRLVWCFTLRNPYMPRTFAY